MLRSLVGRSVGARTIVSARNSDGVLRASSPLCQCSCSEVPSRGYSYYKSKTEESPDKYTRFEKSFKEWEFVEKLIPPDHVPAPPTDPNVELPSGWRPPSPPKNDSTYFIRRTKNHLVPVYLKIESRGLVRHTYIGKVEGNIWQLEKDVGKYLQTYVRPNYPVIIRTNEISRHVIIKGDYVDQVKQWVIGQGF